MTLPLLALAFLAVVGGWVGIPEALEGGNHFHLYLAPVLDPAEAHGKTLLDWDMSEELSGSPLTAAAAHTPYSPAAAEAGAHVTGANAQYPNHSPSIEYVLMALSLLAAASGFTVAHTLYSRRKDLPEAIVRRIRWLHRMVVHKYYVDELYNATMIRGVLGLSQALRAFDDHVIDGIVNGTGWLTRRASALSGWIDDTFVDGAVDGLASMTTGIGDRVRRVQTGSIQSYVLGVFGGIITLIAFFWIFF